MDLSLKTKLFREVNLEKGQLVFSEGEKAQNIYLLNSGNIACFVQSNDKRIIPLFRLSNEGVFGDDGVLSESQTYQYFAVALEDSVCTLIPRADVNSFLNESSDWVKNILNNISDRINHTIDVIADQKIIDDRLNGGEEFSQAEEKIIINSLSPKD